MSCAAHIIAHIIFLLLSLGGKGIKNRKFRYGINNCYHRYAKSHLFCSANGIAIAYQLSSRLLQIPICDGSITALYRLFNNIDYNTSLLDSNCGNWTSKVSNCYSKVFSVPISWCRHICPNVALIPKQIHTRAAWAQTYKYKSIAKIALLCK
jgi:hypothetical protein